MTTTTKQTYLTPRVHARLSTYATLAGVALAAPALAPSAKAAIVYSGPLTLAIPNSIDGLYINFVTGVTGSSGTAVPGYDFNPYNNGAGLTFYGASSPSGILASRTPGTNAVAQRLTLCAPISSASSFYNPFQTQGTLFQNTGTAYVGLRFQNEATLTVDYGWALISTTAASGFPATILGYAYENTGAGIAAGAVPEPTTTATLGFGVLTLGAVGVRRWRRRKLALA